MTATESADRGDVEASRSSFTIAIPSPARRQSFEGVRRTTFVDDETPARRLPAKTGVYADPQVYQIAKQIQAIRESRAHPLTPRNFVEVRKSFLIDPRTSPWIGYWDILVSIALMFTAMMTPVEVGFLRIPADRWRDPLFLINRVVDVVFIVDMITQFFLMVPKRSKVDTADNDGFNDWVTEPSRIAKRYVTSGWFWLDFLSIAISGLDLAVDDNDEVSRLKALRALRVLRLLKLVRLLRGSRIFKRWETRLSINYAILSIVNICMMLLFVCHLFACVWGLQASFDPMGTWLAMKGYCTAWSESEGPCPDGKTCDANEGWVCEGASMQYLYSLYWAIATVTSIGYGDIVATPLHGVEQLICVCMMLSGSLLFAYLVGSFCSLASNLSPDVVRFRQDLTDLNKFLTANDIPNGLRYELREYMHHSVYLRRAATGNRLLGGLAPKLRNEVALEINEKWLEKVELLRSDLPDGLCPEGGLILELAFAISLQIFPPGDACPVGSIYIVSRGAALFAGKAYRPGTSWGEAEALLTSERLRFPIPAVAVTYLFAYSIGGAVLRDTMGQPCYPEANERLRRRRLQWVLRRGVVRAAEEKLLLNNFKRRRTSVFSPTHLGLSKLARLVDKATAHSNDIKKHERLGSDRRRQRNSNERIEPTATQPPLKRLPITSASSESQKQLTRSNSTERMRPPSMEHTRSSPSMERPRLMRSNSTEHMPVGRGFWKGEGADSSVRSESSFLSTSMRDGCDAPEKVSHGEHAPENDSRMRRLEDAVESIQHDMQAVRTMLGSLLEAHTGAAQLANPSTAMSRGAEGESRPASAAAQANLADLRNPPPKTPREDEPTRTATPMAVSSDSLANTGPEPEPKLHA